MVPRLFFDGPLAPGRTVVLPPRQAHHALRVLRLGAGDDVVLFDGGGGEYAGRIEPAGAALRVALLRHEPADRAPPLVVTLAQALVAAEKMDWLVQKATELGVAGIAPIETERCVVRLSGERSVRRVAHLREVAVSACEQCGLNRVPQVADLERLPDFLAAAAQDEAARIVLAPGAPRRLAELPRPAGRVILLVGPEGGFGDNELAAARSCGFEQVSLGPRTLRTETAGLAAIAAMLALWGDFSTAAAAKRKSKGGAMFESAELGHKIDKASYDEAVPGLRADLLDAQYDVGALKKFPVLILINGVEGAGKGETVNILNAWMDPRHILTHAFADASDEERERPFMWRFWQALPPKGKVGILFGNWYSDPILRHARGECKTAQLDQRIEEINRFEAMLAQEGVLVLKFWFHLSKAAQKDRLKTLSKDPDSAWRVTDHEWELCKMYERFRAVSEHVLRHTSSAHAPWIVVEGADARYRYLTVGRILLDAMRKRLAQEERGWHSRVNAAPLPPATDTRDLLNTLVLRHKLAKEDYAKQLEKCQGRLAMLSRHPRFRNRAVAVVLEGMDAAGKGGVIRRLTCALDARQYRVIPIAAPTEEERAQPYLWRFWRQVPRKARVAIFDRSWYGRVLVERVEGFCAEPDWMRAYAEINDFEDQLVRDGIVVAKFWMAISQDEQLKRFQEREKTRFKRFKITEEDWRNREKWDGYEHAVCDMIDRTSTEIAPWTLVEADNKYFARIKVLRTLCERIEQALD